ncbi:MAG TPA: phosphoribosyltransferase [Acidimicrobiales bacterium]|nr:phosphoribosyltransferase [Acidimicrobiales bacterium]
MKPHARFRDREDAGRQLALALQEFSGRRDVLVLGLPRGGVPVAGVVARDLHVPLDALIVRKVGFPGHEEFAVGAVGPAGVTVIDWQTLAEFGLAPEALAPTIERERDELQRREHVYRDSLPFPDVRARVVIIVDDGLATGASMAAAVETVRHLHAARVIVAVPVASVDGAERLRGVADDVVALRTPDPFTAVGLWYDDFGATTDEEVISWLEDARAGFGQQV